MVNFAHSNPNPNNLESNVLHFYKTSTQLQFSYKGQFDLCLHKSLYNEYLVNNEKFLETFINKIPMHLKSAYISFEKKLIPIKWQSRKFSLISYNVIY